MVYQRCFISKEMNMVTCDAGKRLDATSAPDVEEALIRLINLEKPSELVCDFSGTEYVSSAGLRVMLMVSKRMMAAGGVLRLSGMKQPVYDVFKLAGFTGILTIDAPSG